MARLSVLYLHQMGDFGNFPGCQATIPGRRGLTWLRLIKEYNQKGNGQKFHQLKVHWLSYAVPLCPERCCGWHFLLGRLRQRSLRQAVDGIEPDADARFLGEKVRVVSHLVQKFPRRFRNAGWLHPRVESLISRTYLLFQIQKKKRYYQDVLVTEVFS